MGFFDLFRKRAPQKPEPKERRGMPRWKIGYPCKMQCPGMADPVECVLVDLNYKGIAFSLAKPLPVGCVALSLIVEEQYHFNFEIFIAWHIERDARNYYGAKFTRLRESDKEKMYKMMKEIFPQAWKI